MVEFVSTNSGGSSSFASEIKFNLWREQKDIFDDVSGYRHGSLTLTGVEQPQQVNATFVTKDYFRMFGLPVVQGRSFAEEGTSCREAAFENGHDRCLGNSFWKSALGGEPDIVGRSISLNGDQYQVVGIMAAESADRVCRTSGCVSLPFPLSPISDRQVHYFEAVGRLKPGVTFDMANARLQLTTQNSGASTLIRFPPTGATPSAFSPCAMSW